jgi:hypothetical protein
MGKRILPFYDDPISSEAHPPSYKMGTRNSFPQG